MEMKVFDQVYNELTLLQQEDKDDLEIAEQSLMAAMVFTMTNAPSVLNGLCLISNTSSKNHPTRHRPDLPNSTDDFRKPKFCRRSAPARISLVLEKNNIRCRCR